MESTLPPIPAKRYFTIGEVGDLCGVKPHVLRYWEQEFTQLRPMKRRGNRRYYQHHEVLMIRRIRDLLYDQGFTISGARTRLQELDAHARSRALSAAEPESQAAQHLTSGNDDGSAIEMSSSETSSGQSSEKDQWSAVVNELIEIRELLNYAESGRPGTL